MMGIAGYRSHRAVEVVIGVDTHKDRHVAVAIDGRGVRLGAMPSSGGHRRDFWTVSLK